MKIELDVPKGKVAELVDEERPKNVIDRIKTFEDACREMGIDADEWMDDREGLGFEPDVIAYMKLRIIVAALNEGWKPKFTPDEFRYYPYFYLYTKEEVEEMDAEKRIELQLYNDSSNNDADNDLLVGSSDNVWADTVAYFSARLAVKSRELAEYCGRQFHSIWADYVYWGED